MPAQALILDVGCGRALNSPDAPTQPTSESRSPLPAQQPVKNQAAKKHGWKKVVAVVLIVWFSLTLLSINALLAESRNSDLAYLHENTASGPGPPTCYFIRL